MKPINEMSLTECLEALRHKNTVIGRETADLTRMNPPFYLLDGNGVREIANRIHELTRWISVEERLPTCEIINEEQRFWVYINGIVTDACISGGVIHIWDDEAFNSGWSEYKKDDFRTAFTHWRRIDKPEGV